MLILTRRPGESIVITTPTGDRIHIAVLSQKG
ncbi:MAG: carbon storage regulator, partial [Thiogranum sp.]|nr:carbon storage regulator [Thiogranum sp.]